MSVFHCGSWRGFRGPAAVPQGPRLGPQTHKRTREEAERMGEESGGRRRLFLFLLSKASPSPLSSSSSSLACGFWSWTPALAWHHRPGWRTIQSSRGGAKIIGTAGSGCRLKLREKALQCRCVWTPPSGWYDHQTASICPVWLSLDWTSSVWAVLVISDPVHSGLFC